MNFFEHHNKAVAGILCSAAFIPAAAAVSAMEEAPGWHDEKYVTSSGSYATGWQEIEGSYYYFNEEGEVDEQMTEGTKTTMVTDTEVWKETVEQTVEASLNEIENKESDSALETEVPAEPEAPTVVETPVEPEEPVQPAVPEAPVVPVEPETPAEPEVPAVPETPVQPEVPADPETPVIPVVPAEPALPEAPVQPEIPADPYAALNEAIVNSAMGLVGVTNGMQCTEVATLALQGAGVPCGVMWPDQYTSLGFATGEPKAGNLIYYYNGGRGIDHVAIYIGNGMAVHGNYNGQTVIASAYIPGSISMTYIQVAA